jgi:hypothetical protein
VGRHPQNPSKRDNKDGGIVDKSLIHVSYPLHMSTQYIKEGSCCISHISLLVARRTLFIFSLKLIRITPVIL